MENRYKIIISGKNLYKEFEIPEDKQEFKIGTNMGNDFRLYKDLFFEPIELVFTQTGETWSLVCPENLYVSTGDSRKLMAMTLKHGDIFTVKYQESDNDVFVFEFY